MRRNDANKENIRVSQSKCIGPALPDKPRIMSRPTRAAKVNAAKKLNTHTQQQSEDNDDTPLGSINNRRSAGKRAVKGYYPEQQSEKESPVESGSDDDFVAEKPKKKRRSAPRRSRESTSKPEASETRIPSKIKCQTRKASSDEEHSKRDSLTLGGDIHKSTVALSEESEQSDDESPRKKTVRKKSSGGRKQSGSSSDEGDQTETKIIEKPLLTINSGPKLSSDEEDIEAAVVTSEQKQDATHVPLGTSNAVPVETVPEVVRSPYFASSLICKHREEPKNDPIESLKDDSDNSDIKESPGEVTATKAESPNGESDGDSKTNERSDISDFPHSEEKPLVKSQYFEPPDVETHNTRRSAPRRKATKKPALDVSVDSDFSPAVASSDLDSDFTDGKAVRKSKTKSSRQASKRTSHDPNGAVLGHEIPPKMARPSRIKAAKKTPELGGNGERQSSEQQSSQKKAPVKKGRATKAKASSKKTGSSSESEWEEIASGNKDNEMSHTDDLKPVNVVVEQQKNKKDYFVEWIKQNLRAARKARLISLHKAYLCCFIAAGMHRNRLCSDPELQCRLLSLAPKDYISKKAASWNQHTLSNFTVWFLKSLVKVNYKLYRDDRVTIDNLLEALGSGIVVDYQHGVLIFVAMLRALGLQCRLAWNVVDPPTIKAIITEAEMAALDSKNKEKQQVSPPGDDEDDKIEASDVSDIRALILNNESSLAPSDLKTGQSSIMEPAQEPASKGKGRKKPKDTPRTSTGGVEKLGEPDEADKKKKIGIDMWAEVFIENCKWCSVSLEGPSGIVGKPYVVEKHATQPVAYVFTFDNEDAVKDVTKRYAIRYGNFNRKLRVDWIDKNASDWLHELLRSYKTTNHTLDAQDDANIADQMNNLPLPSTVSEAKDHALYVLERHLLKFEVLHPKMPPVLGHIKGEPVFHRKYVKLCHTEQNWLKEGMSIKPGEYPAKYVRPIVTKRKLKKLGVKDSSEVPDIGIFGDWQVERFQSPPVEDGNIPRNEFGNVELFKPWMLPPGSVYIKDMPGLDLIARDLDVDCVPAMTGWDFVTGFQARPIIEGFVVCQENEDLLREVWRSRQDEASAKAREARAIKNWKKLMRHFKINQMLKRKYEYSKPIVADDDEAHEKM